MLFANFLSVNLLICVCQKVYQNSIFEASLKIALKVLFKVSFSGNTVLPHYLRFQNSLQYSLTKRFTQIYEVRLYFHGFE